MALKKKIAQWVARREWIGRPIKRVLRSRLVTTSSIYQRWILRKAARTHARLPTLKPWVLLETTVTCNAGCVMCLHSKEDMRGEMSLELYEKLIREVKDWGIDYVSLSVYGEPFADRHWMRRIEIAREHGVNYRVVSNGSIYREEILRRMLELGGWQEIIFSVNGFSVDAYEKMMPPLKRDKVYGNIDRFLELRAKHAATGAQVPDVLASCVVTRINEHERDDYRKYWKSKPGIKDVLMADVGSWLGAVDLTELTVNGSKRHVAKQGWLAPCPSLWGQLTVLHDGRVLPCCEDHATRKIVLGNANEKSLREIFEDAPITQLRQMHLDNRRCDHESCGKCKLNMPFLT